MRRRQIGRRRRHTRDRDRRAGRWPAFAPAPPSTTRAWRARLFEFASQVSFCRRPRQTDTCMLVRPPPTDARRAFQKLVNPLARAAVAGARDCPPRIVELVRLAEAAYAAHGRSALLDGQKFAI